MYAYTGKYGGFGDDDAEGDDDNLAPMVGTLMDMDTIQKGNSLKGFGLPPSPGTSANTNTPTPSSLQKQSSLKGFVGAETAANNTPSIAVAVAEPTSSRSALAPTHGLPASMNQKWTSVDCTEQHQQCSECMKLTSDKGVIDDIDGSFYCVACWTEYVDDVTSHAAVDMTDSDGENDPLPPLPTDATPRGRSGSGSGDGLRPSMVTEVVTSMDLYGDPNETIPELHEMEAPATPTEIPLTGQAAGSTSTNSSPPPKQEPPKQEYERHSTSYVGKAGVLKPDGEDQVSAASEKMRMLSMCGLANDPVPATLAIEDNSIRIRHAKTGSIIEAVNMSEITFTHFSEDGQLSFITTQPRSRIMLCYICEMDDRKGAALWKEIQDSVAGVTKRHLQATKNRTSTLSSEASKFVRQASTRLKTVDTELKPNKRTRALSVKRISREAATNKEKKVDLGAPTGISTCAYLGRISVQKQRGEEVVVDALKRLVARPEFEVNDVALVTSLEGQSSTHYQSKMACKQHRI